MEAPFQGTCKISSQGPFSKEFTRSLHLYKDPWKNSQDLYIRRLARNLQDLLTRTKSIHKIYLQGPVQGTYKISLQEPFQKKKNTRSIWKDLFKELARSLCKNPFQKNSQDLHIDTRTFPGPRKISLQRPFQSNCKISLQGLFKRTHKISKQGHSEFTSSLYKDPLKFARSLQGRRRRTHRICIYIYTRTLGRNLRTLSRNWQNLYARSLSHKNSQDLYFYTSPHKAGGGSFHSEDVFI